MIAALGTCLTACGDETVMNTPPPFTPRPPSVTVLVSEYGRPVDDARVIFHGADGRVLGTDSGATVTHEIENDAMITWIESATPPILLWTIAAEPTQKIKLKRGGGYYEQEGYSVVRLPGPFVGATRYTLENECEEHDGVDPSGGDLMLYANNFCVGFAETVLAFALDRNGSRIAYTSADVEFTRAFSGPLVLPAWREDFVDFTVTTNNLPSDASLFFGDLTLIRNHRLLAHEQHGHRALGAAVDLVFREPPFGEELTVNTGALRSDMSYFGKVDRAPIASSIIAVDLNDRLPAITQRTLSDEDLAWSFEGHTDIGDAVQIVLVWPEGTWTIFLPPTAVRFGLPMFPDALASARPSGGLMLSSLELVDDDAYDGWAKLVSDGSFPIDEAPDFPDRATRVRYSGK